MLLLDDHQEVSNIGISFERLHVHCDRAIDGQVCNQRACGIEEKEVIFLSAQQLPCTGFCRVLKQWTCETIDELMLIVHPIIDIDNDNRRIFSTGYQLRLQDF